MKKIFGLAVVLVLVASLVMPTATASGKTLEWGKEVTIKVASPGGTTESIATGSDVLDLSAGDDGKTLWAIVEKESDGSTYVQRSTNSGQKFSKKTPADSAPVVVAVSPDDPQVVVAAGEDDGGDNYVWMTDDNGETWSGSDVSTLLTGDITCIDLSYERDDARWIAVGDDAGNLALCEAEAFAGWMDATAWTGWAAPNAVLAVMFSPLVDYDDTIVVVTTDGLDTDLQLGDLDAERWNDATDYPAEITGDAATVASLDLPDTYDGVETGERVAYIGSDVGVYRMDDTDPTSLKSGNWPSVAYNSGDNKLLAGYGASGRVDMSDNPDAGAPSFVRPVTLKTAGGDAVSAVAWLDLKMFCATTGDQSAVSTSMDATSWNGLSVCDTNLDDITDLVVADDGSKMYVASLDGDYASVWRKASRWERVLVEDTDGNDVIIRLAPDMPEVVFIAQVGTDEVRVSHDSAQSWRRSKSDVDVKDMAVKSDQIAFTMDSSGKVSTSTDGGRTYEDWVKSNVSGDMIIVEPVTGDVIAVGGSSGYVRLSISKNDGNSWSRTPEGLGLVDDGSATFVAADPDYDTKGLVYVTQKENPYIYRWGSDPDDWEELKDPFDAGDEITGFGFHGGALWALYTDGTDSGFARSIDPHVKRVSVGWVTELTGADVTFDLAPQAVAFSSGSTRLWAVNTDASPNEVYSFTDPIGTDVVPELIGPDDGYKVYVDVALERISPLRFSWKEVDKTVYYYLRIGTDAKVSQNLGNFDVTARREYYTVDQWDYDFIVGETYYWKVRVSDPVRSSWSEIRSFTVEKPESVVPVELLTPGNGAMGVSQTPAFSWQPIVGVASYSIVIAGNSLMANPIAEATGLKVPAYRMVTNLEYGKTYFWRITPAIGEPSPVFTFTVMDEPVVPPPVVEAPREYVCPQDGIIFYNQEDLAKHWAEFHAPIPEAPPPPPPPPVTPSWVWIVVGIGAALVIATLVLIVTTRRPPAP
jgi:hypothetical protein